MNTRKKLIIARLIFLIVKASRSLLGLPSDQVICRRSNLDWKLDLAEGIDLSIYLFGRFESGTSEAIASLIQEGSVVVDIGANIGAHSLPMAKIVGKKGKVYAFEPTDWAFRKLNENLSLNPDLKTSLIPHQLFLGDGSLQVPPSEIHSSWNLNAHEKHDVHGGVLQKTSSAGVKTLDQWIQENQIQKLDLIKLDVDGFECKILRGATQTLQRLKPKIILELTLYCLEEQGDSLAGLLDQLQLSGYQLFTENGQSPLPMDFQLIRKMIPEWGGINVLAIPQGAH